MIRVQRRPNHDEGIFVPKSTPIVDETSLQNFLQIFIANRAKRRISRWQPSLCRAHKGAGSARKCAVFAAPGKWPYELRFYHGPASGGWRFNSRL